MRFLFFSDIQVSNKNMSTAEYVMDQIIDYCQKDNISRIIFGGDLLEKKRFLDIPIFNMIYKKFFELSKVVNKIYLLVGNHDLVPGRDANSIYSFFPFAKVISKAKVVKISKNLTFYFSPYCSEEKSLKNFIKLDNHAKGNKGKKVLFFHHNIDGIKINEKYVLKGIKKKDIFFKSYDLSLGGHIHDGLQLSDNVYIVGSPYQQNFGESLQNKGFCVFDVKSTKIDLELISTFYPKYIRIRNRDDYEKYEKWLKNSNVELYIEDEDIIEEVNRLARSVRVIPPASSDNSIVIKDFDIKSLLKDYLRDICEDKFVYKKRKNELDNLYKNLFSGHRNIKIKRLYAENAMSYKQLDIDLSKFSERDLIFIQGINKDEGGSNGAGKSSILDILYNGLYGKALRGEKATKIVNNKIKMNCFIRVNFEVNGEGYEIHRYRKHNKHGNLLCLFKEEDKKDEYPSGVGMAEVQQDIDNLLCKSCIFRNISIIRNSEAVFSGSLPSRRREIFEHILGLEWIEYIHEEIKSKQKDLIRKKEKMLIGIDNLKERVNQDKFNLKEKKDKLKEIKVIAKIETNKIKKQIKEKQKRKKELSKEFSKYNKAIKECTLEYEEKEKIYEERKEYYGKKKEKIYGERIKLEEKMGAVEKKALSLKRKKNAAKDKKSKVLICTECYSEYNCKDYISKLAFEFKRCKAEKDEIDRNLESLNSEEKDLNKIKSDISEIKKASDIAFNKKNHTKVKLIKNEQEIIINLSEIKNLKKELIRDENKDIQKYLKTEISVFNNSIIWLNGQLLNKEKDFRSVMGKVEDSKFWSEVFSKSGFRNILFDRIIPYFESRLNYYISKFNITASVLIKGRRKDIYINLKNKNERIQEYSEYSGGEKKRIDFSILLALNEVAAKLSARVNVLFADELLTSVDNSGAVDIYEILKDFVNANNIIVFSISHSPYIQAMFNKFVCVVKRKGISEFRYNLKEEK